MSPTAVAPLDDAATTGTPDAAPRTHHLRLPASLVERLRCPRCRARLVVRDASVECSGMGCAMSYPIVDGIPVLINEERSLFSIADFVAHRSTTLTLQRSGLQRLLADALDRMPSISGAVNTEAHYRRLAGLLTTEADIPDVLVVGGSIVGAGMEAFAGSAAIRLIATDVSFGPCTVVICDAHDLPFEDGSFDGVVMQAVLEHVVDPVRCVEEAHRVLKDGGAIYAETPFMQQVHMGPYDFTRFTHSGHRRLFRRFDEVESGVVCGPGMALAWAYQYFLLSFATSHVARGLLRAFASLTSFHLKYVDRYLVTRPGAIDAAAGCYFLGRKSQRIIDDRELVAYYRGAPRSTE